MRIGILGGGQLARMMAAAGQRLDLECTVLDPAADACAGSLAAHIVADYDDRTALDALASQVDIATFDFENVPVSAARHLERHCPFYPPVPALAAGQDRLVEKRLLRELGIHTPDFHPVGSRTELLAAVEQTGYPAVLKTRRMGYDGKGQVLLGQPEDLERAWQRLGDYSLILESFVPFDAECSIIAVRDGGADVRYWPLSRNLHRSGVLAISRSPYFSDDLQRRAESLIAKLLDRLDYIGTLTLELFLCRGELLANEIAPRVHNSGHWTIEGSSCSQFENHLRAIAGLPLGDTAATEHCMMLNWIGSMPVAEQCMEGSGIHWHDYGKSARPGRKLGHTTIAAPSAVVLRERFQSVAELLDPEVRVAAENTFAEKTFSETVG